MNEFTKLLSFLNCAVMHVVFNMIFKNHKKQHTRTYNMELYVRYIPV
jgi:hypothetical protein